MIKSAVMALVACASTLGAGAAHAGGVSWSIGINAPVYGPAYPVYAPAPVYAPVYAPVPVYEAAPPVAYYPRYGYYGAPVVYARYGYGHPYWRHGAGRGYRHDGHRR